MYAWRMKDQKVEEIISIQLKCQTVENLNGMS